MPEAFDITRESPVILVECTARDAQPLFVVGGVKSCRDYLCRRSFLHSLRDGFLSARGSFCFYCGSINGAAPQSRGRTLRQPSRQAVVHRRPSPWPRLPDSSLERRHSVILGPGPL